MGLYNNVICAILLLMVIGIGYEANGVKYCPGYWKLETECDDDQYCCGINNDMCCSYATNVGMQIEQALAFVILVMIVCVPIYCCYRCCRRTSNPGFVYSPANATPVTVTVPPQQPYPSVMPYPQQTPYPVQQPVNPYYGGPPPPYHTVQGSFQNASAPTI